MKDTRVIEEAMKMYAEEFKNGIKSHESEFVRECTELCMLMCREKKLLFSDSCPEMEWERSDFIQECLMHVLWNLGNYRSDMPFVGWYWTLCRNLYLKQTRRAEQNKRYRTDSVRTITRGGEIEYSEVLDGVAGDTDVESESIRLAMDAENELSKAMNDLKENYRKALVLHFYRGLSVKETAGWLAVSVNEVNNWISRGKKKLYLLLKEKEIDRDDF